MIIDCHGHYTTAPAALQQYRDAQLARLTDPALPVPANPQLSDDEISATIEANQLRIARERGTDLTIFSPRASTMRNAPPRAMACTTAGSSAICPTIPISCPSSPPKTSKLCAAPPALRKNC